MDRETDFFGDVVKIALGIFFGGALIWLVVELRARYELQQVAAAVSAETAAMRDARERRLEQQRAVKQLQQDQAIKAANRERAAAAEAVALRREAIAAEERKRRAWSAYWQQPAECANDWTVECGNAHIRAKREFERRWSAGEL